MRGLTTAERDALVEMAAPGPDTFVDDEQFETMLVGLALRGRVSITSVGAAGLLRYSITELGRLALRLWPMNKET